MKTKTFNNKSFLLIYFRLELCFKFKHEQMLLAHYDILIFFKFIIYVICAVSLYHFRKPLLIRYTIKFQLWLNQVFETHFLGRRHFSRYKTTTNWRLIQMVLFIHFPAKLYLATKVAPFEEWRQITHITRMCGRSCHIWCIFISIKCGKFVGLLVECCCSTLCMPSISFSLSVCLAFNCR